MWIKVKGDAITAAPFILQASSSRLSPDRSLAKNSPYFVLTTASGGSEPSTPSRSRAAVYNHDSRLDASVRKAISPGKAIVHKTIIHREAIVHKTIVLREAIIQKTIILWKAIVNKAVWIKKAIA